MWFFGYTPSRGLVEFCRNLSNASPSPKPVSKFRPPYPFFGHTVSNFPLWQAVFGFFGKISSARSPAGLPSGLRPAAPSNPSGPLKSQRAFPAGHAHKKSIPRCPRDALSMPSRALTMPFRCSSNILLLLWSASCNALRQACPVSSPRWPLFPGR